MVNPRERYLLRPARVCIRLKVILWVGTRYSKWVHLERQGGDGERMRSLHALSASGNNMTLWPVWDMILPPSSFYVLEILWCCMNPTFCFSLRSAFPFPKLLSSCAFFKSLCGEHLYMFHHLAPTVFLSRKGHQFAPMECSWPQYK